MLFGATLHHCIHPALSLSVSTQCCSEQYFIVVSNQRYPCQYPLSVVRSNASFQPALSLSVSTQCCSEQRFIVVSTQRYPCQYPPSVDLSNASSLYPTSIILVSIHPVLFAATLQRCIQPVLSLSVMSIHPVLFGAMLHRCIQPVLSLSISTQCCLEQCFIVVSTQCCPCQYPPSVVRSNASSLYPTSVVLVSIHLVLFGAMLHRCIQPALSLSVST